MKIPIELYAPFGTPHAELQPSFLGASTATARPPAASRVQPAWVALAEILRRIEEQPYHWPVGRTTFRKIAYVATAEGLPTGLRFERGSYGPFAPEMKGLIARLVNNGLLREERPGRMFAVRTGPTLPDATAAFRNEIAAWEPIIERVADLFVRMNTMQAETTATVLFAAHSLSRLRAGKPAERDVLEEVMKWKQRRRPPLAEAEIARAVRNLAALGWLYVRPSPDLPLPEEMLAEA